MAKKKSKVSKPFKPTTISYSRQMPNGVIASFIGFDVEAIGEQERVRHGKLATAKAGKGKNGYQSDLKKWLFRIYSWTHAQRQKLKIEVVSAKAIFEIFRRWEEDDYDSLQDSLASRADFRSAEWVEYSAEKITVVISGKSHNLDRDYIRKSILLWEKTLK